MPNVFAIARCGDVQRIPILLYVEVQAFQDVQYILRRYVDSEDGVDPF